VELQIIVHFTEYYLGDQIKEDEMGEACSTVGKDEKCIQYFGWKNLKRRDHM
jgi:hypothetical protein